MKKIFYVYDVVNESSSFIMTAPSAGAFARRVIPAIQVPLRDVELREVISFINVIPDADFDSMVESCNHEWSCYKFPETKAEAVAPLGIEVSDENFSDESSVAK